MAMFVWAVKLCTLVSRLRRFGRTLKPDNGGDSLFRTVGTSQLHYTAVHPKDFNFYLFPSSFSRSYICIIQFQALILYIIQVLITFSC
jgi:hypothetical protein